MPESTNEKEISDLFLTAASELAFQYDCTLLKCGCNEEGWWVSVDGLPSNQLKMEMALGDVFAEWDRDGIKPVKIPIEVIE